MVPLSSPAPYHTILSKQAADLEAIKVEVESQAQQLILRITCLNADAAALRQRVAELETALDAARTQAEAALAAQQLAEVARADAEAAVERAEAAKVAALTERQQALCQRDTAEAGQRAADERAAQARAAQEAAEQLSAAAQAGIAQAEAARAAAEQRATEAAVQQQRLEQEAAQLRGVRDELNAALDEVRAEVRRLSMEVDGLETERTSLQQQRDTVVLERTEAAGKAAGAYRQAERLAALSEEQEQQRRLLEGQVAELQSMLGCQAQLQAQLSAQVRRSDGLSAQADATHEQLEKLTALCERVQVEKRATRHALSDLRAEHTALTEQTAAERRALEARLAEAEAGHAALAAVADSLAVEKRGLEGQVVQLRSQLERSNSVLDAARRSLAESCARNEVNATATTSLQDLLQSLRAELLHKEEAIGRLTRQNEERCAALTELQQQLIALRVQMAGGGTFAVVPPPAAAALRPLSDAGAHGSPASIGCLSPYSSSCSALLASSPGVAAHPPPPPPVADSATALRRAPAPARQAALLGMRHLSVAAAAVPQELGQDVSFLLELVVERRVTCSEAQAVIAAAAGGDHEPLLSVVEGAKQQVRACSAASLPQRVRPLAQQAACRRQQGAEQRASGALSPDTAQEVAAIRAEIEQLRDRG